MNKINWKQKLSSRKFWTLITAALVAVLICIGADSGSIEKITAMVGAFSAVVAYIMAEGKVDAAAAGKQDLWP